MRDQSQNSPAPTSMSSFDPSIIRNFSIIAHIDHGKSTLADRLLELSGCIQPNSGLKGTGQVLDTLQVERERGITVKAQAASMIHFDSISKKHFLLNLIDTPVHFYPVSYHTIVLGTCGFHI